MTGSSGVKRPASFSQLLTTEVGQINRTGRLFVSLPVLLKEGQGLNRLAQPHIVGQACPQAPPAQESEPGVTPSLVRAQGPLEFRGYRKLFIGGASIQLG